MQKQEKTFFLFVTIFLQTLCQSIYAHQPVCIFLSQSLLKNKKSEVISIGANLGKIIFQLRAKPTHRLALSSQIDNPTGSLLSLYLSLLAHSFSRTIREKNNIIYKINFSFLFAFKLSRRVGGKSSVTLKVVLFTIVSTT